MKRAILAATALLSSSIISSPALAAVTLIDPTPSADPAGLNDANLALAQAQCDAAAATYDLDGPSEDSNIYTGEVVEGVATYVSGPTEVGTHSFATNGVGEQTGAGTFTPAHRAILGDPYRNGGSVNMFGTQAAVGGHYSNSSYDFEGTFTTTYAHAYTCTISVEVFHAAVHHDAVHHAAEGHYVNCDFGHGQGNDNGGAGTCEDVGEPQGSCAAHNAQGSTFPGWGEDTEQCKFITTQAAYDDPAYDDPAYHDAPAVVATGVPGGSYNQDQTDTLLAHEDFGEGFDPSETLIIGQVVVCISPVKKGGTWRTQNGYTGTKCTTAWYTSGAMVGVPNLNTGSNNWVTIPIL
jgi:hypothetical protein